MLVAELGRLASALALGIAQLGALDAPGGLVGGGPDLLDELLGGAAAHEVLLEDREGLGLPLLAAEGVLLDSDAVVVGGQDGLLVGRLLHVADGLALGLLLRVQLTVGLSGRITGLPSLPLIRVGALVVPGVELLRHHWRLLIFRGSRNAPQFYQILLRRVHHLLLLCCCLLLLAFLPGLLPLSARRGLCPCVDHLDLPDLAHPHAILHAVPAIRPNTLELHSLTKYASSGCDSAPAWRSGASLFASCCWPSTPRARP